MQNHQTKFGRALAILMSLVMALSVVLVNPVDAQAATKKVVKKLSVSAKNASTIEVGKTATATATVKVNTKLAAKDKTFKVKVASSDKSVATVSVKNPSGKKKAKSAKTTITVTGVKAGTATITVTTKGKNAKKKALKKTFAVTVTGGSTTTPGQKITVPAGVDPAAPAVAKGQTVKLTTTEQGTTWKSADTAIATVAADGTVTGVADGTVKINLVDSTGKVIDTIEFKVGTGTSSGQGGQGGQTVTSVTLDKTSYTVETGKSVQALATVVPATTTEKVVFATENKNIATVTEAGIIVGGAAGTTKLTATCGGKSATATIVVKAPASLGLSAKTLEIAKGKEANLTTTVDGVEWSSSKPEVATVTATGTVQAIAAGTTVITAKLGDVTETCTVTVSAYSTENEGITLSVLNPIKNNDGTVIENTCLINQDMTIQAYVQQDLTPVKNAEVKISLTAIDFQNCVPYNFYTMVKGVATDTAVTNENGIAEFTLRPDSMGTIPSTYDNIADCVYASFLVQAQVTNLGNEEDIQVKFGSVLRNGIYVENNDVLNDVSRPWKAAPNNLVTVANPTADLELDPIVPFDGHLTGDDGIYQSWNTNDYYPVQYVASQQVPNTVTLSASPYFVLPPERESSEAKFEVTFDSTGKGTVTSGQQDASVTGPGKVEHYTIYNDGTDETTTTSVINVPEGLISMSVFFDKISVSKYSQLYVTLYESDGLGGYGKLIYQKTYGSSAKEYVETFGKENGVPIENVNEMTRKGILVVSLQSPGQVDVSTTGYVLSKVTGDFNNDVKSEATLIEVVDSVKWRDVTSYARYTAPEELTYADIAALLPEYVGKENTYLIDNINYSFAMRMPVFQANAENANAMTGNALLTATYTSGKTKKTATFAYPTVRKTSWDGTKWVLYNNNELAPKTATVKAIFLGNDVLDENGDIQQKTGGITQTGNLAVVKPASTNVSGAIFLEAKLQVDALEKEINIAKKTNDYEKDPLKGAESKYPLYTYVQFVAKPEAGDALEEIPTFRAVEDQYIIVSAEVRADNNEVQTDQPISFKINGTYTLDTTDIGSIFGTNAKLVYLDEKTDSNGRARAIFIGDSNSYIDFIDVEYKGSFKTFKTFVGFDKNEQEFLPVADINKEYHNRCKLEWLDLGLSYLDTVDGGTWLYSYPSDTHKTTSSTSKAGKTWDVGFLPCAYSPLGTFTTNYATLWAAKRDPAIVPKNILNSISNVGVKYSFEGTKVANKENCKDNGNDVATIYSEKIGDTNVYGKLNLKDSVFVVTYYDSEGELQEFTTVGVNEYNFNQKSEEATLVPGGEIHYTMTWEPAEMNLSFICPFGLAPSTTQDTKVYFLLRDQYNNPVANEPVDLSATFEGVNFTGFNKSDIKTNADGIVIITVPASGISGAGKLIFTAKADEETKVSSNIVYQVESEPELAFTGDDPEISAATPKKVSVKLNNRITPGTVTDAMLKKLVVVKDKDDKELLLDSIVLDEKTLTITLAENTFIENSNYTIEIKTDDTCTIDGVTYVLYDSNGQAIKTANASKLFKAKVTQ